MNEEPLAIARRLGQSLDQVGARWAVGGSVASSVHGIPRSTVDLDIIVSLTVTKVADFAAISASEFDMDPDSLRRQLRLGKSYNIFHTDTVTKIDLFPAVGAFERN